MSSFKIIFKVMPAENGWIIEAKDFDGLLHGYVVSDTIEGAFGAIKNFVNNDDNTFDDYFDEN